MRIAVLSDIHLEFGDYALDLPQADAIILAGDIKTQDSLDRYARFKDRVNKEYGESNVFEVEGNHDAYRGSIEDLSHNRTCEVKDNIAFIGATLWSGEHSEFAYECLSDKFISGFSWKEMRKWHDDDLKFIENSLIENQDKKCVVFTHHLPSLECVNKKWTTNGTGGLNYGFYTDLDWLIEKYNPKVWVFGHTHDSLDKFHSNEKTRLVCNPRGYYRYCSGNENNEFDNLKVIKIG